eukprot:632460-Hanusia_phi.AAC.9
MDKACRVPTCWRAYDQIQRNDSGIRGIFHGTKGTVIRIVAVLMILISNMLLARVSGRRFGSRYGPVTVTSY